LPGATRRSRPIPTWVRSESWPTPTPQRSDADAIVVLTEWAQFRMLDWMKVAKVMRTPVVVDTRNLLDSEVLRRSGIAYTSLGRGLDTWSGMPDSV